MHLCLRINDNLITMKALLTLFLAITVQFSFGQMCNASFNDSIDTLTVYFTNQATGPYNMIQYDFGDGSMPSQAANPTHTYATAGIYEACQMVMDTNGFCFDFTCDTLYLGGATCQSDFYYFPNGLSVDFYSYSFGSYDSVSWSFGDGTISSDSMPSHTYSTAGTYTACLSLFNGGVICDSSCQTVFVDSTTNNCVADFTYSDNNLAVSFTNNSTGNYNVVYWDFGDGNSSQMMNPNHTYATAGTYEVCLQIFDTVQGFCFDDYCEFITVSGGTGGGGCQAAYTYTSNELNFEGTNTSTGNYITAVWDFGDGSTPSTSGSHTYDAAGEYEVCLTVGNIIPFCFSQECKTVTISELTCEADFNWSFNNQNLFAFSNTTTGNFDAVEWSFGDGNTSTFASPSYTYNAPGVYQVCLTTFDNGNMCGYTCKDVDVYPLGLEKVEGSKLFVMFPNPANEALTIVSENVPSQVRILDLSGRVVFNKNYNSGSQINVTFNFAAGSYLVEISTENRSEIQPLIIR